MNDEVVKAIDEILNSKEFAQTEQKKSVLELVGGYIVDFFKWIAKKVNLNNWFSNVLNNDLSPGAALILKIAGVVLISAIIALIIFFVFRNFRKSKHIKQMEDTLILTTHKDPKLLAQKAFEFYKDGDYRQGIRFLYIALLVKFNEKNIIKIDKSKTNGQYLKEIYNSGFSLNDLMLDFTRVFNDYWYGNKAADKNIFDYCHEKYTLLEKEGGK